MSSITPFRLRSLYRHLIRELPPRGILASPRTPLHNRIREQFSSSQTPSEIAVAQAEQAAAYFRHQAQYVTLIERYNPGMGMDEEERVRLTARRVGMDLPAEFGKPKL
jgi:hypothetical protein